MAAGEGLLVDKEREVIEAAMAWADERARGGAAAGSSADKRLRSACYMLKRTRGITGKIRLPDLDEQKDDDPIG